MPNGLWPRRAAVALLLTATLAAGRPAPAQEAAARFRPRIDTQMRTVNGKTLALVTINDQPALSLRLAAGDIGPQERAQVVAERLNALVGAGLQPGELQARPAEERAWQVKARGEILVLIPRAEALAQQSGAEELARRWVVVLRRLLAQPALSLSARRLVVPLGETRVVSVGGAARADDVRARESDRDTAQAVYDPARRLLTVRGVRTGQTTVGVQAEDDRGASAALALPVSVMPYAARIAPTITVGVTGSPAAPAETVALAVYTGLGRAVDSEPGALMRLVLAPKLGQSLVPGARAVVRIPVAISGDNLLPVEGSVAVTIVNQTLAMRPAVALLYSNNPEQIKKPQPLFAGRLSPLKPVRLDFHHQNVSGGALIFHADLVNETDAPAQVQMIAGIAAPGGDTVQVGRRAGAIFMRSLNETIGIVLDIPARTRVPLVTQRFADGLTVSGIVQLQQTGGEDGALALRVSTDGDSQVLTTPLARALQAQTGANAFAAPALDLPEGDNGTAARLVVQSPHVYGPPQIALNRTYAVGGSWTYVRVGHTEALKDASGKLTLFGNYGASYDIALTLSNPTADARNVGVYFAPEAGYAAGVFQVDGGAIQEFDPLLPPAEPELARALLAPGETRVVRVKTIPLNGSAYPASIIAHVLPGLPARKESPPPPPTVRNADGR